MSLGFNTMLSCIFLLLFLIVEKIPKLNGKVNVLQIYEIDEERSDLFDGIKDYSNEL